MKKTILLLFLIVLTSFNSNHKECEITYIANAGFLIQSGGVKILIDALHIHGPDVYDKPTIGLLDSIITIKDIFNKINFLVFTHFHPDHFNDSLTIEFLKNHLETHVICPQQVTDVLKKNSKDFDLISSRINTISPDTGRTITKRIAGLDFTASRVKHGDYEVENLLYIFNLNGIKIMHTGDSYAEHALELRDINIKNELLDIAIVDPNYSRDKFKIAKEQMTIKQIILCHNYLRVFKYFQEALETDTINLKNVHGYFNHLETKTFKFE